MNAEKGLFFLTPHLGPLLVGRGEGEAFECLAWFAAISSGLRLICFPRLTLTCPADILSRSRERGIYFAIFKPFSFQDSKPPSISMTE